MHLLTMECSFSFFAQDAAVTIFLNILRAGFVGVSLASRLPRSVSLRSVRMLSTSTGWTGRSLLWSPARPPSVLAVLRSTRLVLWYVERGQGQYWSVRGPFSWREGKVRNRNEQHMNSSADHVLSSLSITQCCPPYFSISIIHFLTELVSDASSEGFRIR